MGGPMSTLPPGCCSISLWSHSASQPPGPQLSSGLGPAEPKCYTFWSPFIRDQRPPRATVGHRLDSRGAWLEEISHWAGPIVSQLGTVWLLAGS